MSVIPAISLLETSKEIEECADSYDAHNWAISSIDEVAQSFIVCMISPVDNEKFELFFKFDNYPEWPYFIDFIDPETRELGTLNSFPKGKGDSFFHPRICICHPCSRKAHKQYSALHTDWGLIGWRNEAGSLTSLRSILEAIYSRISDKSLYDGRMAKKNI